MLEHVHNYALGGDGRLYCVICADIQEIGRPSHNPEDVVHVEVDGLRAKSFPEMRRP